MRRWVRRLYDSLPLFGELSAMRQILRGLPRHHQIMETTAIIQAIEALKAGNERYRDPKRLLVHGAQYWSQNYEDGMIAEIFRRISTTTKTFLEIGVGDGSENNTTALLASGWSGWWIDGDEVCCSSIKNRLQTMPSLSKRLTVKQALVFPESIGPLLSEIGVPPEVDLFSLDIDLNTYHIWAALKQFRPRVVVVEYNGCFQPELSWIHPYDPVRVWDFTQAFGASLKAYEELGREFGYSLVACDLTGINAFFVRKDLVQDKFVEPFTAENHYEPPRYNLWFRMAHPSVFFGNSQ